MQKRYAVCTVILIALVTSTLHEGRLRAQTTGPPDNIGVIVVGFTVTLTWRAPAEASVASYIIEVGSQTGSANLGVFDTGSAQTSLTVAAPAGTYYVRVRARGAGGVSLPSADVVVQVPTMPQCTAAPPPPFPLTASVTGSLAEFTWREVRAANPPTSYLLQVGSAEDASDIVTVGIPSTGQLEQKVRGVAPLGFYWTRLRATNACGVGAPSNEQLLIIGNLAHEYSGGWTGSFRRDCGGDPRCGSAGAAIWSLDLALQQEPARIPISAAGTFFLRVDTGRGAPTEWRGVIKGGLTSALIWSATLTARDASGETREIGTLLGQRIGADRLHAALRGVSAPEIPENQNPDFVLTRR
jgi:hypothetical protein